LPVFSGDIFLLKLALGDYSLKISGGAISKHIRDSEKQRASHQSVLSLSKPAIIASAGVKRGLRKRSRTRKTRRLDTARSVRLIDILYGELCDRSQEKKKGTASIR